MTEEVNVQSQNPNKQLFAIVAVVIIIGLAAVAYSNLNSSDDMANNVSPTQQTSELTASETPTADGGAMQDSTYQNGEYSVRGSYRSPAGPEEIDVTLTLTNGEITEIEVTGLATNPGSKQYQSQFIEGFKPLVLGKNIDEVELDVVSGSSLTPKGFNDALQKIKQQASQS